MRLLGQIYSSEQGSMRSRGVAIFSGQTLSIPNFSHSLDNFQATLTFDDMKFNLQSLSGEMGGGKVEGNGRLEIERKQIAEPDLQPPGQKHAPLSHGPRLLPGERRPDPEISA